MLVEERRKNLLELISEEGFVSLPQIAQRMGVSESTVRRDLDHLEESGAIKRTHGGAFYLGQDAGLPAFDERTGTAVEEKRAVARATARLIQDGDAVLLDGGTTTYEVARQLVGRTLQVVTNSLPIANLFAASRKTDLILIGGYVYPKTGVALGPLSRHTLSQVHVRHTIMSAGGITKKGLFNSNLLLVETERQMMQAADEVTVVVDHTKFGRQALAHLCELGAVHRMVVDEGLEEPWRRRVTEAGVEIVVAPLQRRGD